MTRAALALLALAMSACVTHVPRTEVLVTVTADPSIVASAASVHVTVLGGPRGAATLGMQAEQTLGSASSPLEWPVTVALVPAGDDADRVYVVTAQATDATGATIGLVRAQSSYVAHRTLVLPLVIEECCRTIASMCTSTQTCRMCMCASDDVPVMTLTDWDGGPPEAGLDVGTVSDSGGGTFTPRNLPASVWSGASGSMIIHTGATIDTSSGAVTIDGMASRAFTPTMIPAAAGCAGIFVIATGEFRVVAGATVSITGARSLAIVAMSAIAIDGTVDVGGRGGGNGPGASARSDGGGYGTTGGPTGTCPTPGSAAPSYGDQLLTNLCAGSQSTTAGSGGGGGALELVTAGTFDLTAGGVIRAVGGGGATGAPGGSGGAVLIQSSALRIGGTISVNGGGGGGANGAGADGTLSGAAAAGGAQTCGTCGGTGMNCGAAGGTGAWQGGAATAGGAQWNCAGTVCNVAGAGGGGAGRIRIESHMRTYDPGRVLEYAALPAVFSDGDIQ